MNKNIASLLLSLEKTREEYWNISRSSGEFLNLLIKNSKIKTVLEIGTSNGYSSIWMAEALAKTKGHLYTIESNKKKRFPLATENFKKARLTKTITQILGHAPEVIPKTPKFFDLIFLDATKYEHLLYLEKIVPRTKKGSIIIADNVISHKKDLSPYVKKVQSLKSFESFLLHTDTGFLVSIKTKS